MNFSKHLCAATFLALWIPGNVLNSQGPHDIEVRMEDLLKDNREDLPEALIETLHVLAENPLPLNQATGQEIESSGLFSPYQAWGLQKYRRDYGTIFSIYELTSIPGFSADYLRGIQPFVSLSPETLSPERATSKGLLLINTSVKLPRSGGYRAEADRSANYAGSPLKHAVRGSHQQGNWRFGIGLEKDDGETWWNRHRPEHLTGYASYSGAGVVRRLIIGNFRVHSGMGLVHGLGFGGSSLIPELNGYRVAYGKPFASPSETPCYRGLHLEAGAGSFRSTAYFSNRPEDLSFHGMDTPGVPYILHDAVRNTGYHRTRSEKSGAGLGREHSAGVSFALNTRHVNTGLSLSGYLTPLTKAGRDSVPWLAIDRSPGGNVSFFATGHGTNYQWFTELAIDHDLQHAWLAATKISINPAVNLQFAFRKYMPGFVPQMSAAPGAHSSPENETGGTATLRLSPFPHVRLLLNCDLFYHPEADYYSAYPGFGSRGRVEAEINPFEGMHLKLLASRRSRSKNQKPLSQGTPGSNALVRDRYRAHYRIQPGDFLVISGRLECGILKTTGKVSSGWLGYQEIAAEISGFRLKYRLLMFDIADWDNRIYAYEPGVRYSFSFPAYYGKGMKSAVVSTVRISRWLKMRLKSGVTHFAYRRETGSGHDVRPGDRQWELEVQLEMKW